MVSLHCPPLPFLPLPPVCLVSIQPAGRTLGIAASGPLEDTYEPLRFTGISKWKRSVFRGCTMKRQPMPPFLIHPARIQWPPPTSTCTSTSALCTPPLMEIADSRPHMLFTVNLANNIGLPYGMCRHFSGDEGFLRDPNAFNDKKNDTTNSDVLAADYSPPSMNDGAGKGKL